MTQLADWWLNRELDADWRVPISSVQGFRLIGGFLAGTATHLEFIPNRLEAMVGAASWIVVRDDIESVTLGRRRLRIESAAGRRTLFTNRPTTVRGHLGALLDG